MRYSVAIGGAVPIGSTADKLRIGYATSLAVSLAPVRSSDLIRLEGSVAELVDKVPLETSRRFTYWTANVVLAPAAAAATPSGYVIGGIGSYHQRAAGVSRDDLGLNLGAGVSFTFGAFGAFTEARLHYLLGDARTKLFPITFGLVF